MTDKDVVEMDVLKTLFPNAKTLLCIFHTLRTFHREINCEKLNITKSEKDKTKEIMEKMLYSKNKKEYMNLYEKLEKKMPECIVNYFNKNWYHIRHEWTINFYFLG